jgi:hypothetical protein
MISIKLSTDILKLQKRETYNIPLNQMNSTTRTVSTTIQIAIVESCDYEKNCSIGNQTDEIGSIYLDFIFRT